jgi:azurin
MEHKSSQAVEDYGKAIYSLSIWTGTAALAPGRYTFYCSRPGHRRGGMVGELMIR